MVSNLLLKHFDTTQAYHATFAIAALVGLFPLFQLSQLNIQKDCHAQQNS